MKKFMIVLALLLGTSPALASHGGKHVFVTANGMVCDVCVQGLKKVFMKNENVSGVAVDLTTKIVTIDVRQGKALSDEEIRKGFYYVDYDIVNIKRD